MQQATFPLAGITEDFRQVIDSNGKLYPLNDPRVVHVYPYATNDYLIPLFAGVYKKRGFQFRAGRRVTPAVLRQARLSFASMTGAMVRDMEENRSPDELSIYYGLEQEGPCQIGAWPLVWETFSRRLQLRDAVFPGHATLRNNYLGQGMMFGTELMAAIVAADILDEAQNALRVLARNPVLDLQDFKFEAQAVVDSARKGIVALELAMKKWARNVSKIPVKQNLRTVPKILIFGGGILSLIHHPLADYFCEKGIIPKVVDFSEFILYLESEFMMRFSFRQGRHTPEAQFKTAPFVLALLNPRSRFKEARRALLSKMVVDGGSFLIKRYKKIAKKSGLIYDSYVPFKEIIQAGNQYIPYNTYCEAIAAVGRFLCTKGSGVFNGFLHVATFNCQPSMDAQAVIRNQANQGDLPFCAIDVETPQIMAQQRRLLETLTIQAWRSLQCKSIQPSAS